MRVGPILPAFLVALSLQLALAAASSVLVASRDSDATSGLTLRQTVMPPRGWTHLGRAPSTHVIQLYIALPQPRFPELEQHLAEISDPLNPRYGEHLSKEAVEEFVAPHPSNVDAVHAWLAGHGIQREECRHSPAGDRITVHVPVAQAEKMLSTVSLSTLAMVLPDLGGGWIGMGSAIPTWVVL